MMKNALLFAAFAAVGCAALGPPPPPASNVLREGGREVARIETQPADQWTTSYQIKSADGLLQASLLLTKYNGNLQARADFPLLNRHYEALYPGVPVDEILAGWQRDGVLVGGKAQVSGLEKYCASRGCQLVDTNAQLERFAEASKRESCTRCTDDYRACQVQRSYQQEHPAPGVHVEPSSCEAKFRDCSNGGIATVGDGWPCGAPPR